MLRRGLLRSLLFGAAGALAARPWAAAAAAPDDVAASRVVYHLADVEKVAFVLGNLKNHIAGTGGPGRVNLALVVHGPALRAFRADALNAGVRADMAVLVGQGVAPFACIHTLEGMKMTLADLVPGFALADKGGVVKLADLQAQGFLYLRP